MSQIFRRRTSSLVGAMLCAIVAIVAPRLALAGDEPALEGDKPNGAGPSEAEGIIIDAIVVEGISRTERHIVDQALRFDEGEAVTLADIEQAVERLSEMPMFTDVGFSLRDEQVPLPDGTTVDTAHRVLHLRLEERATLVPIFGLNRGGDLFGLTLGLGDANAFGRNLDLGGHYRRLDETNSFEAWVRDPRFFAEDLSASLALGWTNRPRVLYAADGQTAGGYLRFRRGVDAQLTYAWSRYVSTGLGLEARIDRFSPVPIAPQTSGGQASSAIPRQNRTIAATVSLGLGEAEVRDYLFDGVEFVQRLTHADELWGSQRTFTKTDAELRLFALLPLEANLAVRLGVGVSGAQDVEERFFLGGFTHVRGFSDSRFRGPLFWLGNVELRLPSLVTDLLVVQPVGFVDAASVANGVERLGAIDGASAGGGIRLILPELRWLTFRLDYAWSLIGGGPGGLSFGTGQYF